MKRLVVCLDGTWNTPDSGSNPTNVVKIMRAIRPTDPVDGSPIPQIVFYDKGVGTGGWIDKVRGGLVGYGLGENVQDGYRFLANNYETGDEIYIFGFSRGAFTARTLAGFIRKVGLASKARLGVLNGLWDHYRSCKPGQPDPALPEPLQRAMEYGHTGVGIRCVGVWDTVGALGVPGETLGFLNKGKYQFHDVSLGTAIDVALHAVAIDEKRGPFQPTLWDLPPGATALRPGQVAEQVWFPGVHSSIGGSYEDTGLSDIALGWMIQRVSAHTGLKFDPDYVARDVRPDHKGALPDSRTAMYTVSKGMPYLRLLGQNKPKLEWWRKWIHRMNEHPRSTPFVNEMIHQSALDRLRDVPDYKPENLVEALKPTAAHRLPIVGHDGVPAAP